MTTTEKIANAKKRIDELERLIKYWNDSEQDDPKIVNFAMRIENKVAQILMIQVDNFICILSDLISLSIHILSSMIIRAIKPIFKKSKEEII